MPSTQSGGSQRGNVIKKETRLPEHFWLFVIFEIVTILASGLAGAFIQEWRSDKHSMSIRIAEPGIDIGFGDREVGRDIFGYSTVLQNDGDYSETNVEMSVSVVRTTGTNLERAAMGMFADPNVLLDRMQIDWDEEGESNDIWRMEYTITIDRINPNESIGFEMWLNQEIDMHVEAVSESISTEATHRPNDEGNRLGLRDNKMQGSTPSYVGRLGWEAQTFLNTVTSQDLGLHRRAIANAADAALSTRDAQRNNSLQ